MRATFWVSCRSTVGRFSVWIKLLRVGREASGFTHCRCCMFRLLLIAELCDVVCVMLHGVWSVCVVSTNACALYPSSPVFPLIPPFFLFFTLSPPFFPLFAAVSCDLDEPASWFAHMEEAGFQKVPEDDSTTASRVSCLWELHWDKLD